MTDRKNKPIKRNNPFLYIFEFVVGEKYCFLAKVVKKAGYPSLVPLAYLFRSIIVVSLFFALFITAFGFITQTTNKESNSEKFLKAKDLKVGDVLYVLQDGKLVQRKIINLKKETKPQTFYNLSINNGSATFFANNFAVHNKQNSFTTVTIYPFGTTGLNWFQDAKHKMLPSPKDNPIYKWALTVEGEYNENIEGFNYDVSGSPSDPNTGAKGDIVVTNACVWNNISVSPVYQLKISQINSGQGGVYSGTIITCDDYKMGGSKRLGAGEGNAFFSTIRLDRRSAYRVYGLNFPEYRKITDHTFDQLAPYGGTANSKNYDFCSAWLDSCSNQIAFPNYTPTDRLYDVRYPLLSKNVRTKPGDWTYYGQTQPSSIPYVFTGAFSDDESLWKFYTLNYKYSQPANTPKLIGILCGKEVSHCDNNKNTNHNHVWKYRYQGDKLNTTWDPEFDGGLVLKSPGTYGSHAFLSQTFDFIPDASGTYAFKVGGSGQTIWVWEVGSSSDPYRTGNWNAVMVTNGGIGQKYIAAGKNYRFRYDCSTGDKDKTCQYGAGVSFSSPSGDDAHSTSLNFAVIPKNGPCTITPANLCKNNGVNVTYNSGSIVSPNKEPYSVNNFTVSSGLSSTKSGSSLILGQITGLGTSVRTGGVKYDNGKDFACTSNVAVYPNPSVTITVRKVDDCSTKSGIANVGNVSVVLSKTGGVNVSKTTSTSGVAQFYGADTALMKSACAVTNIDQCTSTCGITGGVRINAIQSPLLSAGYVPCDAAQQSGWTKNGYYWNTDPNLINSYSANGMNNKNLTFYVRSVAVESVVPSWVSIANGNYTVTSSSFSMEGNAYVDDVLVKNKGTVFSGNSNIQNALTYGKIGPSGSDVGSPSPSKKVYYYDSQANSNDVIPTLLNYLNGTPDTSLVEVRTNCSTKTASTKSVLYYKGCALSLNASEASSLNGASNILDLLVVENGVTVANNVIDLDFSLIVGGDLTVQ